MAGVASGVPSLLGCSEKAADGSGGEPAAAKNKRQLVLDLLDESKAPGYVPAAFFIHFAEEEHVGPPAIEKHKEYFRFTGMDFVKIQYEAGFPLHPEIERPADWAKLPLHGKEFYADQVGVVEGLVKALKKEALVVCTLYSPFMLAGGSVGPERLVEHIEADPEAVKKGLEIVTESLLTFVRECVRVGVDGFYASTQGGEAGRFSRPGLFQECVMPFDLRVQREINETCLFNILHVCDYHLPYDDLTPFLEYPGDVVNCSLHVGEKSLNSEGALRALRTTLHGRPRPERHHRGRQRRADPPGGSRRPRGRCGPTLHRGGLHAPRRHRVGEHPDRDRRRPRLPRIGRLGREQRHAGRAACSPV